MKTKFFKKLSFVLAVAMVLSVFAPAAGAFAAKAPKLNATKKYLHLDVEGKNKYDFNISNKQKGWKYYWESSNEDVAEVNEKNGLVTATGVGTAKITVTIEDKNGEEVDTLKATVVVRDNIKTVKITNLPEDNKVAVGKEHDFNRSFVTNSGSTKKTSAITRWTVEPADKATINDSGVFKADEAGKYTITARSFQSKEKYTTWLANPEANKDLVLAEDSVEITVAASMVEAKQVDLSSFDLTFDSAMEDVAKNITVYQMVGNTKVKQLVKDVEMDETKKVATVSMYQNFAQGATYVVEYPEMEAVSFVAATAKYEDVADIKIATTTAVKNEGTDVEVQLLNKDGVDITTNLLLTRVTLKGEAETGAYFDSTTNKVYIYEVGKTVKVTATYHTYKYNKTTGEEEGTLTAVGTIVGVDAAATNVTGVEAWTIVNSGNGPDWKNVNQLLAADDYGKKLFVKINTLTGKVKATDNNSSNPVNFDFETNDKDVLMIDTLGNLYPVAQGSATVIVKYSSNGINKVPVATVTITVGPKKQGATLTASANEFVLSNKVGLGDQKTVKVTLKDQLGRGYQFTGYKIDRLAAPIERDGRQTNHDVITTGTFNRSSNAHGEITLTFNGDSGVATAPTLTGVYVYKITAENISTTISVEVKEPIGLKGENNDEPAHYGLEFVDSKDLYVDGDTDFPVSVGIRLFGYAANGVKYVEVNRNDSDFRIEVDAPTDNINPNGQKFADIPNLRADGYDVVTTYAVSGVSGSVIRKAPIGTYVVTAYKNNKPVASRNFTVVDTQVAPTFEVKSLTYLNTLSQSEIDASRTSVATQNLIDAVTGGNDNRYGLKFTLDGDDVEVVDVNVVGTPSSIYVNTVTVRKLVKGNANNNTAVYLEYVVTVGIRMEKK